MGSAFFLSLFRPYIVLNRILKGSKDIMTKTMLFYKRSHSSAELVHDPKSGLL